MKIGNLKFLILLYALRSPFVVLCETKSVFFKRSDISLPVANKKVLTSHQLRSNVECVSQCCRTSKCSSAAYDSRSNTCHLYQTGKEETDNRGRHHDSTQQTDTEPDRWITVFFLPSGSGYLPYTAWTRKSTGKTRVYRSSFIDEWETLHISQVKINLMENGRNVHYVIFNGTDTNSTGWLSSDKIIDSSWEDIKSYDSYHKFSLIGNQFSRQVNMNQMFISCGEDFGWMTAIVHEATCPVTKVFGRRYPYFVYSPGKTRTRWIKREFRIADALKVSVKRQRSESLTKWFKCTKDAL